MMRACQLENGPFCVKLVFFWNKKLAFFGLKMT